MITGMHAIVFSPDAAKVRASFSDVLGMPSAGAGGGWLIFARPPAELAVHPADGDGRHDLYLMRRDRGHAHRAERQGSRDGTGRLRSGLGLLAAIRLPDGSEFPVYEPRHPSPIRA